MERPPWSVSVKSGAMGLPGSAAPSNPDGETSGERACDAEDPREGDPARIAAATSAAATSAVASASVASRSRLGIRTSVGQELGTLAKSRYTF